ncbi:hypothetical protein LOZ39_005548 [Ophidiomyces ophidiicola]|nr:hypothetical protein LOZ64_004163 [Ophidiomyces ophidiicola]KAI1916729.1 hypothetical protein LOZ61_000999 [Ophidiomyces ophidiicola]KAI1922601.1 hypothetical protein LOZ60_005614 [Ophidiomyces ophidiicola]KAI1953399.1 hypothetical protein LOZ59_005116 [Ophidiomyces ophidiicola]KAI2008104.1 hypothetical protein LOZ49_004395 [Ophidiomyces ophidiicola]
MYWVPQQNLEKPIKTMDGKVLDMSTLRQMAEEMSLESGEEGLPIVEIVEELDDEDKVISGCTTTPGKSAEQILKILKDAGVEDDPNTDTSGVAGSAKNGKAQSPEKINQVPVKSTTNANQERKTVDQSVKQAAGRQAMGFGTNSVGESAQAKSGLDGDIPVTEIDESPEDAALRREFLQYSLEEVGAVVAELELDESASEFSISDEEYDQYSLSDEDDEDEDEDEYGRTTRRVISDDYHQQMRQLEERLNAKMLHNIGPDPGALPLDLQQKLEQPGSSPKTVKVKGAKKKKVSFADELDIAPDSSSAISTTVAAEKPSKTEIIESSAIQNVILEHKGVPKAVTAESTRQRKASRFKTSRTGKQEVISNPTIPNPRKRAHPSPNTLPLFPAKPLDPKPFSQPIKDSENISNSDAVVDKLVEREVDQSCPTSPDPDDFDEALLKREMATTFYTLRNRKIQQEGGFMREDESGIVPLDDESQEAPKRISRFKSARVQGDSSR